MRIALLLVVSLALAPSVHAQEPTPPSSAADAHAHARIGAMEDLELQSPGPSTPVFAIGWRNQLTARIGASLDAFREPRGWAVRVDPAVELFNTNGLDAFPYQSWRGLLSVHATWRDVPDPTLPLATALRFGLAHESDHQSAPNLVEEPYCGWAYTNTLFVEGRGGLDLDEVQLSGALRAAWHFFSFTRVDRGTLTVDAEGRADGTRCPADVTVTPRFEDGQDVELTLDLALRTGAAHALGAVSFCAAVHVSYMPSTPAIYEEARAIVSAGGCYRDATVGDLQLVGELWLGSYVGRYRFQQFPSAAASFRWAI